MSGVSVNTESPAAINPYVQVEDRQPGLRLRTGNRHGRRMPESVDQARASLSNLAAVLGGRQQQQNALKTIVLTDINDLPGECRLRRFFEGANPARSAVAWPLPRAPRSRWSIATC